jgi:medium-chain acyl-[acyl-carrier-protein] hydrolase
MTFGESPWIVRLNTAPRASLRLFCFAHAGGGASVYRAWPADLDPRIEVLGVETPGRGRRFIEPPFTRLGPLLDAMLPAILPFLAPPFAFFSHSLGTLVSFELCRRLRAGGHSLPVHLFVSGRRAPQLPPPERRLHTLSDAALLEELRRYNGTPAKVLAEKELMELMLPILRADFAVLETYSYVEEPPLDLPITALGGTDDRDASAEQLDAWGDQTTQAFRRRMFPGDHFYLFAMQTAVSRAINEDLGGVLHG